MADIDSWTSIQNHGLLSTSALLDLFEVTGLERTRLESHWRPRSVTIQHPAHGRAVIRDQIPMPPERLRELLVGMELREWYELINGKTFFWADEQRLLWMLDAAPYRNRRHCVLTVDTRSLLDRHLQSIWLTDQNSGSVYSKKPRGRDTFKRVEEFDSYWVAEVAVDYSVPDVVDFTIEAAEWKGKDRISQIWSRGAREVRS